VILGPEASTLCVEYYAPAGIDVRRHVHCIVRLGAAGDLQVTPAPNLGAVDPTTGPIGGYNVDMWRRYWYELDQVAAPEVTT